jgi:hypothetical protein
MRLLSVLLAFLIAAPAFSAVNPIYARLKAYRTYHEITKVDAQAHRFYVWFSDVEPTLAQVAGNTVEEMAALTEQNLNISWGAFGIPPDDVPPVPAHVQHLADAMLKRIQELRPNASGYLVSYAGEFRLVGVTETTPFNLPGNPDDTTCHRLQASLKLFADGTIDGTHGLAMAGTSTLAPDWNEANFQTVPRYVDFRMPPEIEGTSVLWTPIFGRNPIYAEAHAALLKKIVETVKAIDAGSYENPIEAILSAQGSTPLPVAFSPTMRFSVDAYARTEDWGSQMEDTAQLTFTVREALAGPVTKSYYSADTTLAFDLTVDLQAMKATVKVTTPGGATRTETYEIAPAGLILEGTSAAVKNGWLHAQIHHGHHDFTLPGEGGFTAFDIYPGQDIRTSYVHGPDGIEKKKKKAAARAKAPPATEVKANAHAAASLASALLALTPATGSAAAESEIAQHVASAGLGEVMGWGQDYWDSVDAATTSTVIQNFQAAFRLMETAFAGTPTLPALTANLKKLANHFLAMRKATAAAAGDAAQQKRQARTLAKLAIHHLKELVGSPMLEDPKLRLKLAARTLIAAASELAPALGDHPALAALRALGASPPATLDQLNAAALPLLEQVQQATR